MTKHNVTVYSTTSCPYCVMAKNYLNSKGVEYRDLNVGIDNVAADEMIKKVRTNGCASN